MKGFFSDVSGFLCCLRNDKGMPAGRTAAMGGLCAPFEHMLNEEIAFRLQNVVLLVNQVPFSGKIHTLKRRRFQEAVAYLRLDGDSGEDGDAHIPDDALLDRLRVEHVLKILQADAVCFEAGEDEAARGRLNLGDEAGIFEQLGGRNAFKGGQRMIRREDDDHVIVKELAAYIGGIMQDIVVFRDQGKGDDVLIERIDDAREEAERKVDRNIRILLFEFNQRGGEKVSTDGIGRAEADFTAAGAVERIEIGLELAVVVLQMAAEGIQQLSVLIERHLLAVSVKEGITDLLFKRNNLLGERWLGAVERLGGFGHAAVIDDGAKTHQFFKIHGAFLSAAVGFAGKNVRWAAGCSQYKASLLKNKHI